MRHTGHSLLTGDGPRAVPPWVDPLTPAPGAATAGADCAAPARAYVTELEFGTGRHEI